ncbi:MAG: hypothetical protein ACYC0X_01080 [Pirellulaceae bacterium]
MANDCFHLAALLEFISNLLMYGLRTASKSLAWLLAALLPLPGLAFGNCACRPEVVSASEMSQQGGGCRCCCQKTSQPDEPSIAVDSCCQRIDADVKRTCGCREIGCQCEEGGPSQRPVQIPPEHRTWTNDLAVSSLAIFSFECGDRGLMEAGGRMVTSLSSADRCVLLCRFRL